MSNNNSNQHKDKTKYSRPNNNKRGQGHRNYKMGKDNNPCDGQSTSKDTNIDGYGKENDPAWYNKQSQLVKDVTSIPFANQLGRPVRVGMKDYETDFQVPGVMVLHTIPVPGIANTASDGVNIAATGLFQFIRKNLSTVASYAPADVMMCVLGIDNIYALYSHIKRAFGIINLYSSVNLYYNKRIFNEFYGFGDEDYAEFVAHINSYRSRFNNLIYKASALYLPTDFSITSRHAWEYTNIFIDGDSVKSQLYGYTPAAIYRLNETMSDNGTALEIQAISHHTGWNQGISMQLLLDLFDDCIERFRNSESMNIIQADMRRAFEGRTFYTLSYVDENYLVMPVKSAEVMSQIENTTIYPSIDVTGNRAELTPYSETWNITQSVDKNIILFAPKFASTQITAANGTPFYGGFLLNFHWDNPSNDDILVATRNLSYVEDVPFNNKQTPEIVTSGVDIVVGCDYLTDDTTVSINTGSMADAGTLKAGTTAMFMYAWTAFDWAPILWCDVGDGARSDLRPICDFDNYTTIERDLLKRINDNVLMNMWSIPQLGMFQG